jgi:hypothetical protein
MSISDLLATCSERIDRGATIKEVESVVRESGCAPDQGTPRSHQITSDCWQPMVSGQDGRRLGVAKTNIIFRRTAAIVPWSLEFKIYYDDCWQRGGFDGFKCLPPSINSYLTVTSRPVERRFCAKSWHSHVQDLPESEQTSTRPTAFPHQSAGMSLQLGMLPL